MSPYHFRRTFRAMVDMTPHQFILHTRLLRAAVRLRRTADSISAIAFAAGFSDLSTFNRRFQRIMGRSRAPIARRRLRSGQRQALAGGGVSLCRASLRAAPRGSPLRSGTSDQRCEDQRP